MFDLLLTNATLADGREAMTIACKDGRITALAPRVQREARKTIDANVYLASPPFIDSHFHINATLSLGAQRLNQ